MLLSTFFPIISFNITALQGILVFLILLASLLLGVFFTKRKPSKKVIITSLIVGILVSLLTTLIGTGSNYKFGWPMYFLTISEYVLNSFKIIFERLLLNTSFYVLAILNISWFFSLRKTVKSLKIHVLPLLTLFALLVLSVFCLVNVYEKTTSNFSRTILPDDDTEQKREPIARNLVESQYPEFKDFENQKSFAGNSVFVQSTSDSIYLAYVTNGSGVSFVDGTCFKVDSKNIVSKIGKLIVANSSTGRVDPKSCSEEKN